ncbi:MAG: FGGY-family carbohydrate kinase [Promicromonosporaceae bacterium]|nr:FGGY-family carbohydrate kinase [Promicromonosporaceae bacterium]
MGSLGIELGSTNIKACLVGPSFATLSTGSHTWENDFRDRLWTYSLDSVWEGIQGAVREVLAQGPVAIDAIGISAMMHGYLAFSDDDELVTPFRTWRNTNTGPAAKKLTAELNFNIPLRWSVAHLYQAILDSEPHLAQLTQLTTLAGYVHWKLTGQKVLGVGDASGMFPIDPGTGNWDLGMAAKFDDLARSHGFATPILDLLPKVLPAGADAGHLTAAGARLLDPTGTITPGIPFCPPEGDAGTGMVATNAVAPRTGNVSVGTSIFAMVVLEHPLFRVHEEIDVVTTPAGDLVAMVHCNNGASEFAAWAGVFGEFAEQLGARADKDAVFAALLAAAALGEADGGGLLAYNYLAGEPITRLAEGRPLVVRSPSSNLNLANFARAQVYGIFATLALGMRALAGEGVRVDELMAHGGLFRTAGVAQRILAAFVGAPVAVATTAAEGGAWGIAVLAAYAAARTHGEARPLAQWLTEVVFRGTTTTAITPEPGDLAGVARYLREYEAGLKIEQAAVKALAG